MASDAGSMRRVSFGNCGGVSFRSCAYLFQIDNNDYVNTYTTTVHVNCVQSGRKGLQSKGSFNSISDRVHSVRHDALAGCAHRNARWSPVLDGIG